MAKQIIWTEKATEDFYQIIIWLEIKWSLKVADDFSRIAERKIELLSHFPEIGPRSEKNPRRRKFTLTKHNILIYTIEEENLVLLSIFDTRQDPERNIF